jgi:hypothetical protein
MYLRRFVVMPLHMTDRAQIHHDRPMDLRELLRIKLLEQFLQRRTDHRFNRFPSIPPRDDGVLCVGAKVIDVIDRDETHGFPRLRANPSQRLLFVAATLQLRELLGQLPQ